MLKIDSRGGGTSLIVLLQLSSSGWAGFRFWGPGFDAKAPMH